MFGQTDHDRYEQALRTRGTERRGIVRRKVELPLGDNCNRCSTSRQLGTRLCVCGNPLRDDDSGTDAGGNGDGISGDSSTCHPLLDDNRSV